MIMKILISHAIHKKIKYDCIIIQQVNFLTDSNVCVHVLPYSLKFSRLKIFMDFIGQGMAAKFFIREISSS